MMRKAECNMSEIKYLEFHFIYLLLYMQLYEINGIHV